MAQTIQYYQKLITDAYVNGAATVGITIVPDTWSAVELDRFFIFAIAFCAWTLDSLFDLLKLDINEIISSMKPHSLRWYAQKAKAFQYGYNLVLESDYYDNTGIDETLVANSKIISNAAVVEQQRGLRIKVATDNGTDLQPLNFAQLTAFKAYMKQVKDAGVKLDITTAVADDLSLSLRIVYNPLVLNAAGQRIDGTSQTPVQDAIRLYLKNLPFNGVFSLQKLVDVLQLVDGVSDLNVDSATARYGALPFSSINISYLPDAGYLRIANADLQIQFIPA